MNSSVSLLPVVIAPYKGWGDKTLDTETNYFWTCMDGNINFPTLTTQVGDFGKLSAGFRVQLNLAKNRDRNAIALKNDMRAELIEAAIALGVAVQQVAGRDLAKLISSGAPLRRAPQPVLLKQPELFEVTLGDKPGELFLKTLYLYGALIYNFNYAAAVDGKLEWKTISISTSEHLITGLQEGMRYHVFIEIFGSRKQSVLTTTLLSPIVQ